MAPHHRRPQLCASVVVLLALLLVCPSAQAQPRFGCDAPAIYAGTSDAAVMSTYCGAGFVSCAAGAGTPCTVNGETYHINYGSQVIDRLDYYTSLTSGGPAVTLPNSTWVQRVMVRSLAGSTPHWCVYNTATGAVPVSGYTPLYPSPPAKFKTPKRNSNNIAISTFTVCMPATGNLPQPAYSVAMTGVGQYTQPWQW